MADYSEAMSEISGYPKALSHAGAGGGNVNLKTIVITNTGTRQITVSGIIDDGYYGAVFIGAGETAEVKYVTPIEQFAYTINAGAGMYTVEADGDAPEGVTVETAGFAININIADTAEDGAALSLKVRGAN